MKTLMKKISTVIILTILFCVLSLAASAETYSGNCGDNVTWSLDTGTGVLKISGKGEMFEQSVDDDLPWEEYKNLITIIEIDDGVTVLSSGTLYWYDNLKKVIIPNSVTNLNSAALAVCDKLESIVVGDGNQNYSTDKNGVLFNKEKNELYVFPPCCNLKSYSIPNTVIHIDKNAFDDTRFLEELIVPASVASFEDCYESSSLTDTGSIQKFIVDTKNPYYSSDEYGVLFNKEGSVLLRFASQNPCKKYTVPTGVTEIGGNAFYECDYLEELIISDTVTTVNSDSFNFSVERFTVDADNKYFSSDEYGVLYNKDMTELVCFSSKNTHNTCYVVPEGVTKARLDYKSEIDKLIFHTGIKNVYFAQRCKISTICYTGSETEWNKIEVNGLDEIMFMNEVNIIFNYNITNADIVDSKNESEPLEDVDELTDEETIIGDEKNKEDSAGVNKKRNNTIYVAVAGTAAVIVTGTAMIFIHKKKWI